MLMWLWAHPLVLLGMVFVAGMVMHLIDPWMMSVAEECDRVLGNDEFPRER